MPPGVLLEAGFHVSVVIPTFNRKLLVERAIHSVLDQTRQADEIILVDDGSSDRTFDAVRKKYPRIRCFRLERAGISQARNFGIEKAMGNWIGFLDSDDVWLPEKLTQQEKALQREPCYQICHTNEIWIRNGRRVNPKKKHQKYGGMIFEQCLPLCVISPSSVLIHRDVFHQYGMFDPFLPVCEDYDLWLRFCAFIPVLYLDKPLVIKYGGHHDQLSRKYWGMDRFRIYALEKILNNESLERQKRIALLQTLTEKIHIYYQGARKRKKMDEAAHYKKKLKRTQEYLESVMNQGETSHDNP